MTGEVAQPGKAIASGGSTGQPKVIVDTEAWARDPHDPGDFYTRLGLRPEQVQLVGGAMHHNTPFGWCHAGLFYGHTIVLMVKFDADKALALIGRHRVQFAALVPTMMARMARSSSFASTDLSSLETLLHTAAPCPGWLKRLWIARIGASRVMEAYGASDYIGACAVRGDEWLLRPGTVGRGIDCDVSVRAADGTRAPAGVIGDVFMRRWDTRPAFRYAGEERLQQADDGYLSVGDMGHLDHDGYLFLADRRNDLIITGGTNVYPAEVEAVITQHPGVADAAVIGLPDDEWGQRVHAVVQPADGAMASALCRTLKQHCNQLLAPEQQPKTIEMVSELPRDDAGKLRRSQLVEERAGVST